MINIKMFCIMFTKMLVIKVFSLILYEKISYFHLYLKLKGAQNTLFQSSMRSNIFVFFNSLSWQKWSKTMCHMLGFKPIWHELQQCAYFQPARANLTYFCDYFENYHTAFYIGVYFLLPLIILNQTICDKPMFCPIVLEIRSHTAIMTSPWRPSWILRECPCFEMSTWSQIFIWGP